LERTGESFWPVQRSPAQRAGFSGDQASAETVHGKRRRASDHPNRGFNERRNFPLAERLHSISTIISTSTALLEGSPAIPTAERACLPSASPNTSTIKSENPFITRG
jgi:hypothetical protein